MTSPADRKAFNEALIKEFRANEGKVGGRFEGRPVLLLTTTGAKSGRKFTIPLVYLQDGDRRLIFASKAGSPTNPDWYHNLVANPEVTVELGTERFQAQARVTEGEERDRLYDAMAEQMSFFAEYQRKTERRIPLVVLERTG
jgi:deazaflavin-dependent oxidoreductase (nitroreductase family)